MLFLNMLSKETFPLSLCVAGDGSASVPADRGLREEGPRERRVMGTAVFASKISGSEGRRPPGSVAGESVIVRSRVSSGDSLGSNGDAIMGSKDEIAMSDCVDDGCG